tara:strand:- start:2074 stop:3288 length:1215 start_codon:yes stop_codon:yes gene_type:complete
MIPFSPPFISREVIDEVVDSLESGWITTGPKVLKLEKEISKIANIDNVVCVNSWTSGAILTFYWFGLGKDDEVIVPVYTYSATAISVIHAGAKIVMVDIGDDFNINIKKVEEAITDKTKAIMPVDFAGLPADYSALFNLVNTPKIKSIYTPNNENQKKIGRILIVSDAAHSLGASFYNEKHKCLADLTIYSLHAVKNFTTAEGGAIAINLPSEFDNEKVYKEMRLLSLNCQTKDALAKTKPGNWKYDIIGLGLKINMPDVNAAIGLGQLIHFKSLSARRKEIFKRYSLGFSKYDWAKLPKSSYGDVESSYHLFPLRFPNLDEPKRDRLIELISLKEVAVNVHFIPMPMLTYFKHLGFNIIDYPVAYKNYSTEISIPLYPQLTDESVDFIIETVVSSYQTLMSEL